MELKIPNIFKKAPKDLVVSKQDVIEPMIDDGSIVINSGGVFVSPYIDGAGVDATREQNILKWRKMSRSPDISSALSEIITDAIIIEENKDTVSLDFLPDVDISENIKEKLVEEFKHVLKLLNFHKQPDELFEEWLVDSVQYFHKIFDDTNVKKNGIIKLVKINPLKIAPIKEVTKRTNDAGIEVVVGVKEYFLIDSKNEVNITEKIKIPKEAVAYVYSGITDDDGRMLSILEAALKPSNQLNDLEDSTVIYSVARAPQKRVFYVDVGNLPKTKAEAYMQGLITKFKNKMVYDSNVGSIKDSRHISAMVEDYWLPRKSGSKGTEISTIDGGGSLDNLDEIMYFRKKLYKAMRIPTTRLDTEQSFSMGREGEITRDEVKFGRYINKMRSRYGTLFNDLLRTQAIVKGIVTEEEWEALEPDIKYKFLESTHFAELIESEMYSMRFDSVNGAEQIAGKYVSNDWIRRVLLKQSEEDMKEEDAMIKKEKSMEQYKDPEEEF